MNMTIKSVFLANSGALIIVLAVVLVLALLMWRWFTLNHISKSKIASLQLPEYRDKHIILRDRYEVKTLTYFPLKGNSKAIIIGVHGLQAQKDDYKGLGAYCLNNNLTLISYDRRGAGKNDMLWKFRTLDDEIKDVKDVVVAVSNKFPGQPIILYGESLGAALISAAAYKNALVQGVVLSNFVSKKNPMEISLKIIWAFFVGFFFSSSRKTPFYIDLEQISNSKSYITNATQRYTMRESMSLKFLLQCKKLSLKVPATIRASKRPTLILQSADDVFCDYHQLKVNTKRWNNNQTYKFYMEGKHALLNEPNANLVFIDVKQWIENNITTTSKGIN